MAMSLSWFNQNSSMIPVICLQACDPTTKTHLTTFPPRSKFQRSMTAASAFSSTQTAFGSSAGVFGVVIAVVAIVELSLGLISPGAVAG